MDVFDVVMNLTCTFVPSLVASFHHLPLMNLILMHRRHCQGPDLNAKTCTLYNRYILLQIFVTVHAERDHKSANIFSRFLRISH